MYTRPIILQSVVCISLPYFSKLSHNGTIIRLGVIEHKIRVSFPLQLLSETFLILRITQRDIIIHVHRYVILAGI
jgi:hypothetical protein